MVSTFMLSTKQGKEAYVEPVVGPGGYRFTVKVGAPLGGACHRASCAGTWLHGGGALRIDSKLLEAADSGNPAATGKDAAEELCRIVATIGRPGAGARIRCVISVNMLSEGWDANNVTHILGLRGGRRQRHRQRRRTPATARPGRSRAPRAVPAGAADRAGVRRERVDLPGCHPCDIGLQTYAERIAALLADAIRPDDPQTLGQHLRQFIHGRRRA